MAPHPQPGRIGRVTTHHEALLTMAPQPQPGRIGRIKREHGHSARATTYYDSHPLCVLDPVTVQIIDEQVIQRDCRWL